MRAMVEAQCEWYSQVVLLRRHFWSAVPLAVSAVLCCSEARALERVNLRNGFSYDCTRREVLTEGQVRLYLSPIAAESEANYIDLPSERIASVESLPDPPPPAIEVPAKVNANSPQDVRSLLAHAGRAGRGGSLQGHTAISRNAVVCGARDERVQAPQGYIASCV